MPAFDKNSVQIDYAYSVNPIDTDETPLQPCPHCGHPGERKHRSVCLSCKRRIPPIAARQSWEFKVHNPHAEISPYVVRTKEVKQQSFFGIKKAYLELIREYRKFIAAVAFVAAVFYATPYISTQFLGQAKWHSVVAEWQYLIGATPAPKTMAGIK
ncbi:MAG TPA: hypothetical protein V6C81_05830 [Planktothrix sp.]|jgi:hypothetical protein